MYKVYCDNTLICDSRIEESALINPKINLEENKAGSFSFKISPDHMKYDSINQRKSIIEVYQDEELKFCGIAIEVKSDFYKQKEVYCEGVLTFLNDSIQRPARYQNITVRGLLETYIANHNAQVDEWKQFKVGIVTVTDPNDSLYRYTNMENTLTAIKEDLVDDLGGFLRIRHVNGERYIDYLAESQNTNSQVIKIGKNLMDFTSTIDSSDIATAIIPLGAKLEESTVEGLETRLTIESVNDGKDFVFSQEAVDEYGWIYKTVEYDDVTTASALKSKGQKYLTDVQFENMVIEAKAIDLHLTDKDIECFNISDEIRVVSSPHGLDRYFRLTKMTLDLNNPSSNTITLGKDEKVGISAKTGMINEAIKKAVESIVPSSSILKQAVENATALITSAMGGYVYKTNNELYIMDSDNPETAQKVWRWNINGLGYSSTGIGGPYGLAMTMDGRIVADFISAGTLTGIIINNGNGKFSVDKDGNMKANSAEITGGKIAMTNGERKALLINKCVIDESKGHYIYTFLNGRGLYVYHTDINCYTALTGGHVESGTFTGTINEDEGLPNGIITPLSTMSYSGMIRSSYAYENTVSYAPNVYVMENGLFKRSASSSQRYKYDIKEVLSEGLNPQKLYDLPVKSFKYKDDYLSKDDRRRGQDILGFIAEDVMDIFEPAIQYDSSGNPEMWNVNVMVPAILKLVQEQQKEIELLKKNLKGNN